MSITFLNNEDKVLRYDEQTLTPEEQAQARANIGVYFSPDDFEGTDSEKLQACFDALANVGGVITINRPLTLTDNVQIKNNSGLSLQIVVQAGGKQAVIDMGDYHFYGLEGVSAGMVSFDNIHFKGTQHCFDCTNLIRLRFDSCFFAGFEHVIYSDSYVQSVNFTNSYFRSLSGYIYYAMAENDGNLYDCRISHSVVEGSNGVMSCMTANGCSFTDNCIEGNTKPDDLFYVYYHLIGVVISNNYFEINEGALIDFSKGYAYSYYRVTISNNHFHETTSERAMITMPTDSHVVGGENSILIYGNEMNVNSTATLIKSERTTPLNHVVCFGNIGTIVDANGSLDYLTASEFSAMVKRYKTTYPKENQRFTFASYWVIEPTNRRIATIFVNTPYALANCDITTVQVWDIAGQAPTSLNISKETHSFMIQANLANEVSDKDVGTCWGAYYITIG